MQSLQARFAQRALCIAAVAGLHAATPAAGAQSADSREDSFSWSGAVGAGRSIVIKNINGPVRVERSSSNRVEVTGEKRWRRGNPADVRIVQPRVEGGDVVICALWTEESTCDANGIHTPRNSGRNNNRNDVSVHFVVRVPAEVRVKIATVNGGLQVSGVTNEIDAQTVNGSIEARSAGGPVRARTVNGSITVGMGSLTSSDNLDYDTVNGSITLELPSDFGAQLELSTVNGRVSTDFPITVTGTLSPRRLRGTIGNGLARVHAGTVNGSVTLRRSN